MRMPPRPFAPCLALVALTLSLFAAPANASALTDGDDAYHSGNYTGALTDYQQALAQATSAHEKGEAYWKEGHAYHKLHQNSQALNAYNQAQQADPALSFVSSPGKLQDARSEVGGGAQALDTGMGASPGAYAGTSAAHHSGIGMGTIFFIIVVVVIIALVVSASRRKRVEINTMRGPLEAQRESVVSGISYLDNYIDVLPKNNADSDQVRAHRQAAAYKLDQASRLMSQQGGDGSALMQAQSLLQQANTDVSNGRQYLDRATGGTGKIAGDDAVQPIPFPTNQAQVNQVPEGQRAVSFFSSQPAPAAALVPVTLNIDGQQRTVMATPQEADEIRRGQIPPVRSFNVGGQSVPWYAYNQYDPYRDYYTYQNNGWRGVAGGAVAGFVGAELLNSLFAPHWGGGWNSPYGFAPGFDSWGGWGGGGYGGFDGGYTPGYDTGFAQGEMTAHQQDYNNYGGGYDTSDYGGGGGYGGGDRS